MLFLYFLSCFVCVVHCQIDLRKHFKNCQVNEEHFDECLRDQINALRPYFKPGLPKYKIGSLDPFFAELVPQRMNMPFFRYKLNLKNVTESGWSDSHITKLKTDFNKNMIQYSQHFPDKRLNGMYEINGTFFGRKVTNQGSWNLKLGDYSQTTTVTRLLQRDPNGKVAKRSPLDVKIRADSCLKLELHIENLIGGRTFLENILDRIINTAWQPGFLVLRPLINDLISTAFTEIFNKNFENFPLREVFPQ